MNDEKLKALYNQVSRRCYITSTDALIVDRLNGIIKNAIYNVKSLLGIEEDFDFSNPSMENELFINFCMYRWNNISQKEFEKNYMGDIIAVRAKYEIEYSKKVEAEVEHEE